MTRENITTLDGISSIEDMIEYTGGDSRPGRDIHGRWADSATVEIAAGHRRLRIYWDDQDPDSPGWAYRLDLHMGTDRHDVTSGAIDGIGELDELLALVAAPDK